MESKKIELLNRENMTNFIRERKDKGCKFWSISRINNFNQCQKQYYLTYMDRAKQKDGIYSLLGSACHSDLENLYEDKEHDILVNKNFNETWMKAELFGIPFPNKSESIKNNYKKDIDMFYGSYEKMEGEFLSELGFVLKLDDINYLMGYIDLVKFNEDGTVDIYDFKTSAMFDGDKLKKAGRQLTIYQMALEGLYGFKINRNAWIMLKYSEVEIDGFKYKAMQNKDIIKGIKNKLIKLLIKEGFNETIAELTYNQCLLDNSLETLPSNVLSKIKIENHIKDYEIDDLVKAETMQYINETIEKVIEKQESNGVWRCSEEQFFCSNLCGFYPTYCCPEFFKK